MTTLSSTVIPPDSPSEAAPQHNRHNSMDEAPIVVTTVACESPAKKDSMSAVMVTPDVVLKGRMSVETDHQDAAADDDDGPLLSPKRSLEAQLLAARTDAQETLTALLKFSEGVRKITTRELVFYREEEKEEEYLEDFVVEELKGTVFATDLEKLWEAAHRMREHAKLVSQDVSMSVQEVSVARQTALEAMERCHKAEAMARKMAKENAQLRRKLSTLTTEKKVLIKEVKSLRTVLKDAKKQSTWNLLEQHIANALTVHEHHLSCCGSGTSVVQQEEKEEEWKNEAVQEEEKHETNTTTKTSQEECVQQVDDNDESMSESETTLEKPEAMEADETTVESETPQAPSSPTGAKSLIGIRSQTEDASTSRESVQEAEESEKPSSNKSIIMVKSSIEVVNTTPAVNDDDEPCSPTEERRRPSSARGLAFGAFGRPKWMLSNEKRQASQRQDKHQGKKDQAEEQQKDKQENDQETPNKKDEEPRIVKVPTEPPQDDSATRDMTVDTTTLSSPTVADEQDDSKTRRGPLKTATSYIPIKLSTSGRLSPTWGNKSKASATTSSNDDSKSTTAEPQQHHQQQQPQQQQQFGVMKFFGRRSPPAGTQASIKRPTPLIAVEALVPKDDEVDDTEKHHHATKSPSASTCCLTVSTSNSPTPTNVKVCTLDDSKQFQTPRNTCKNLRMPSSVTISHDDNDDNHSDDGSSRTSVSSSHLLSPPQLSPIGAFTSPGGGTNFHLPNHSCDPKILRSLAIPASTPSSSHVIIPDEEIGKCYEA